MSLAVSHEDSQILLKDKNVLQESVLDKYRTAGQIAQTALSYVIGLVNDSYHYKKFSSPLTIPELCLLSDSFITSRLEQHYKNKVNERGIALPTTMDVDQVARGWAPEVDDLQNIAHWNKDSLINNSLASTITGVLRPGDVVKISLGVHIDGYTSQVSHTIVIYPIDESTMKPTGPLLGGKADAIAATHIAMETVTALLACALTPEKLPPTLGATGQRITGQLIRVVVDTIAKSYNCCVVPGSRVRRVRRFLAGQNEGIVAEKEYKGVVWTESHQEAQLLSMVDEVKDIALVEKSMPPNAAESAIPRDEFVIEGGEVYMIDLKMCPLDAVSKKGLVTLEDVDSYTGKSHKKDMLVARSGMFVRDFAQSHVLKLKSSRQLLHRIDKQGVYPFKLSHLSDNYPLVAGGDVEQQTKLIQNDLKSFRLGMTEVSNNYLCVDTPIQIAKWVPWDHILKVTNPNGNLSFNASSTLALPGHEIPLPKLGISSLKLKSLLTSTNECISLPVVRECSTVVLCGSDVSFSDRPELLKLTGGSKTCGASWIHSKYEMNTEDPVVQGIFQLAALAKDKRFGFVLRETQPMKQNIAGNKQVDAMQH